MTDSKIFVSLRSIRSRQTPDPAPEGPKCQWDNCEQIGSHRAPVGRDGEGLYLLFCSGHAREYNKGYNFANEQSDPVVARYQREAASGLRRVWGKPVAQPSEPPLPSTARSGSAKALNAQKSGAARKAAMADTQRRRLKVLEARAFETLDLSQDATPREITSRYKECLKMHHPDANQGNRNSEDLLRASIEAYKILKLNGFC
jgi:hypothetical protein